MKQYIPAILLCCIGLTHFPFLDADPDSQVSIYTRGAWTDEGLHTAQLRDYIHHGTLDLYNSNSFVISPVFNVILYPFFLLLGTDILIARLVSLLLTLFTIFLFSTERKYFFAAMLYAMLTLSQFHYFQYTHYAMTEPIAINFVILMVYALIRFEAAGTMIRRKYFWVVLSSFFGFMAYSVKVQFAYIAVVSPAVFFLNAFLLTKPETTGIKSRLMPFLVSTFSMLAFALVYFLFWYLPHANFYNHVLAYETSRRFAETLPQILEVYRFNFKHLIWVPELKYLLITGGISIGVLIFVILKKPGTRVLSLPLIFAFLWFLAEQHKIAMVYLPTRYFLSYIAAAGLTTALALSHFAGNIAVRRNIVILIAVAVMLWQYVDNFNAYQRRTFDIRTVRNYLKNYEFGDQPVLGVWAYTLASETKAPTIGVRYNYLNYKDPINTYKPRLVITEFNEAESMSAFSKQGISLHAISDSMRTFKVWRYDLELYWINMDLINQNQACAYHHKN